MDVLLKELVAWIYEADQTVDGLNDDLDRAVNELQPERIQALGHQLANACELLTRLADALDTASTPEGTNTIQTLSAAIAGHVLALSDEDVLASLEDHDVLLRALAPENSSVARIILHTKQELLKAREELIDAAGSAVAGPILLPANFDPQLAVRDVRQAQEVVCHAAGRFGNAVEAITLGQYRGVLAETSLVLKDVLIISVDVSAFSADLTFVTAPKAIYSMYSGLNSLRNRFGRFTETVKQYFGT